MPQVSTEYHTNASWQPFHRATYLRSPFLRNRLGQPQYPGFRKTIIGLPGIPMCATRTTDIDDHSLVPVLDPEILACLPHEPERRRVMHRQDRIPLFVGDLVDHTVPRVTCVVNYDMDLAVAELSCFLHEDREVGRVCDIARDAEGAVRHRGIDGVSGGRGFRGVDVADYNFGAFVGEEAGAFSPYALPRTCDLSHGIFVNEGSPVTAEREGAGAYNGDLAIEETAGVIEV